MQDVLFSVSSFPVADFEYIRHVDTDCFLYNDLQGIGSNPASDHENCKQWCADNNNCAGFTVWSGICHFKNHKCEGNMFGAIGVNLYLKQESPPA